MTFFEFEPVHVRLLLSVALVIAEREFICFLE